MKTWIGELLVLSGVVLFSAVSEHITVTASAAFLVGVCLGLIIAVKKPSGASGTSAMGPL